MTESPTSTIPEPSEYSWQVKLAVVLFAIVANALGIWPLQMQGFMDDGAFFFRYADHLAQGEGYRWNIGEEPVWGASAPLWPLLLSLFVRVGISAETAALACGWGLTLVSTALLALTALRCVGISAAIWTVIALATNCRYCWGGVQGMESPLGYFLFALGVWSLSRRASWVLIGIVAGLSMAHKIDFAILGPLLLFGAYLKSGAIPWRAIAVATLLALVWYAFAWFHFGHVVPNSFLTKMYAEHERMRRSWFLVIAFLDGSQIVLAFGTLLGILSLWRAKFILFPSLAFMGALFVAYTLRPPTAPFEWYQAPTKPAFCLVAGCGIGLAIQLLLEARNFSRYSKIAYQTLAVVMMSYLIIHQDEPIRAGSIKTMEFYESDRIAAGHWIDEHTPRDARLLTGFGNIAYYSHRYTYDYTYLNRRGPEKSKQELVDEFRPEIIAYCPYQENMQPEDYPGVPGYRIVKIFDTALKKRRMDFFVVVMLRDDVPLVDSPAQDAKEEN